MRPNAGSQHGEVCDLNDRRIDMQLVENGFRRAQQRLCKLMSTVVTVTQRIGSIASAGDGSNRKDSLLKVGADLEPVLVQSKAQDLVCHR